MLRAGSACPLAFPCWWTYCSIRTKSMIFRKPPPPGRCLSCLPLPSMLFMSCFSWQLDLPSAFKIIPESWCPLQRQWLHFFNFSLFSKRKDENAVLRQRIIRLELSNRIFFSKRWGDGLIILRCWLKQDHRSQFDSQNSHKKSQLWWLMLVIPLLGRQRHWLASQAYSVSSRPVRHLVKIGR